MEVKGEQCNAGCSAGPAQPDYIKQVVFPIIIFFSLAFCAYWISIQSPLQFDDFSVIGHISDQDQWNRCKQKIPRRILAEATFAVNHIIHGKETFGYHVVNVIIHALAALGLFALVTQLPVNGKRKERLAWCAGLIFLLHPLATQSVTYISQRYTSIAGMFVLWSLMYYARGRRLKCWRCLTISGILGIAAILCKEYVAGLLLMGVAMDLFLFDKQGDGPLVPRIVSLVRRSMVFLPATLLFLAIYFFIPPEPLHPKQEKVEQVGHARPVVHGFADWAGSTISRTDYMRSQWTIIPATYFRLMLVPVGQSVDHPYTVSKRWKDWQPWLWALGLALFLGVGVVWYRKWPIPAFGIAIIFVSLGPTSTIVPNTEFVAEQRVYLALAGFALIIANILSKLPINTYKGILWGYLIVLGSLTIVRNDLWNSRLGLWQDAIYTNPRSARAHTAAGSLLMRESKFSEAETHFRKALEISPDYLPAMYSLPWAFFYQGKYDECIQPFIWRLRKEPKNVEVICALGQAFFFKGDTERARTTLRQALKFNPYHVNSALTMADLLDKTNERNAARALLQHVLKGPLDAEELLRVRDKLKMLEALQEKEKKRPAPVPVP